MVSSHLCRVDKKAAFFLPFSVWCSLFIQLVLLADSLKAGATQLKAGSNYWMIQSIDFKEEWITMINTNVFP